MLKHVGSSQWKFSERRMVFQNAPAPNPQVPKIIDEVVARAERNQDISLYPSELREIALHRETLKQRADAQLKTQKELRHLAAELKQERELYVGEQATEVMEVRGSLEDLERALQDMAERKPESAPAASPNVPSEVSDIASEVAPKEKGITGQIKGFFRKFIDAIGGSAVVGTIVKGWISFRRQWIEWFPPKDPAAEQKKLNAIQRLYGKFFGADELKEKIAEMWEGMQLKIVEGRGDAGSYATLYSKFLDWQKTLLEGKSEEQKQLLSETHTFEKWVSDQVEAYKKKFASSFEKGKSYVTTLLGIAEGQRPKEESGATKKDGKQGEKKDERVVSNWLSRFFS